MENSVQETHFVVCTNIHASAATFVNLFNTVATGVPASVGHPAFLVILCYTLSILIALLLFSPTFLYPSSFTILPHVLSLSRPSLSPSLSIWLRDILLPNTRLIFYAHKLKPTIPNVCTHTEMLIDVHTYCIQKQRTNGAEMPNMIQHDRGGQQHQQRKLSLVHLGFNFHLKVTVFLRC